MGCWSILRQKWQCVSGAIPAPFSTWNLKIRANPYPRVIVLRYTFFNNTFQIEHCKKRWWRKIIIDRLRGVQRAAGGQWKAGKSSDATEKKWPAKLVSSSCSPPHIPTADQYQLQGAGETQPGKSPIPCKESACWVHGYFSDCYFTATLQNHVWIEQYTSSRTAIRKWVRQWWLRLMYFHVPSLAPTPQKLLAVISCVRVRNMSAKLVYFGFLADPFAVTGTLPNLMVGHDASMRTSCFA